VQVKPGDTPLKAEPTVNTVAVGGGTAFVVQVMNGGNFQESGVTVKFQLGSGGNAITKTKTIEQIAPKQTVSVTFEDVFSADNPPDYGTPARLRISVLPVAGEKNVTNNTAQFTVQPSVTSG
jgi:hypothetical protein